MTGLEDGLAAPSGPARGAARETLRFAASAALVLFGLAAAGPALWALLFPAAAPAHAVDLVLKAANPVDRLLWLAAAGLCFGSGVQLGSRRPELAADVYAAALVVGASALFALSRSLPVRILAPPATPALLCGLAALAGLGLFAVAALAPRSRPPR